MPSEIQKPLLDVESNKRVSERGCCEAFVLWATKLDIYFIRATYDKGSQCYSGGSPPSDAVNAALTKVKSAAGMEEETFEFQSVVEWSLGLYLIYVLGPCTFLLEHHLEKLMLVVGVIVAAMSFYCILGLMHLVDKPRDLHTFQLLEHSPMSGVVMLICTHLIWLLFSIVNLNKIRAKSELVYPLLYSFFVGKSFMVLRMCLAYSSENMAEALDFFIWQELLLTAFHGVGSLFVGYSSAEKEGDFLVATTVCMKKIVGVDFGKTVVVALFWYFFQPGSISTLVDRMPDQQTQVVFAVLVHGVLDLIQSMVTIFTVWLGRLGDHFLKG